MMSMDIYASQSDTKLLTINVDTQLTGFQKESMLIKDSVVVVDNQKNKDLYLDDGVHPNDKGTSVMVDIFWGKFKSVLTK